MRKIRKWKKEFPRIFAVALAAAMLFNMPGTAAYAEQAAADMETPEMETSAAAEPGEDDGGERIPETAADDEKEPETDGENPEEKVPEEETTPPGEDEKNCDCGILCTQDSIKGDCPVCGAEGADLSTCRGEEKDNNTSDTGSGREDDADAEKCICELSCTEDSINDGCPVCGVEGADLSVCEGTACKGGEDEEDTETIKPEDAEIKDTDLCAHHKEHTEDCGYIPVSEDGEGSPCAYECRICPIEKLIADLPDKATEDNREKVRAQLDEILALYGKLTEEEQEQVDLSRCLELQEALDATNMPVTADGHTEQQADDEASVAIDGGGILYYATLEEAFAAANGNTATITMLANAECTKEDSAGSPLNITSGTVTLDMDGHTLSGKGSGWSSGIIGVSGGSLTIQGNGTVQVSVRGVSCSDGTLTIVGTKFNLVGNGYPALFAIATIDGGGRAAPKVNISGGEVAGPAQDGQIYHMYGTTTIHDITMTGTTSDNSKGVYYYNEGTLKINGGSFSNITVDQDTNINSVAELLGNGVTYKHQGGAWATEDDLAAMSIENVTVEKIPLTINPSAETFWYYGSGGHSLTMDAQPVADGAVTYEWYDGDTNLNCVADEYPIQENLDVGTYTYTCEATCDGYTMFHDFTFEIKKSGTTFNGNLIVRNGDTETKDFTVDDTITVIATPTATGQAPTNAVMKAASLTAPAGEQMALYVGDTQVSAPVDAGADGTYTMTVNASDVLSLGNVEPNGSPITLTAKFVGNGNMADAAGTVEVNITAVAKAEKEGNISYAATLKEAFSADNNGATVTLLGNVAEKDIIIKQHENLVFVLDLAGYTINGDITVQADAELTIRDSSSGKTGSIISDVNFPTIYVSFGNLILEGGSIINRKNSDGVEVEDGSLSVISNDVKISGQKSALKISELVEIPSINLSAGTYTGNPAMQITENADVTWEKMLLNNGTSIEPHYAYFDENNVPIPLSDLQGKKELGGSVTVQECSHIASVCEYQHNDDTETHTLTCLACGYTEAAENCLYSFSGNIGTCQNCKDALTVSVTGVDGLTYDGSAKEPTVTVMRDGTALDVSKYAVSYSNNKDAGSDTASVTVTIGSGQGTYTETFSIGRAAPTITWGSTAQIVDYTGSAAVITAPMVALVNGETYNGEISYSYSGVSSGAGLPTDAGTYTIKASIAEQGNYTAAETANTMTLTINRASGTLTVPENSVSKTFGDEEFSLRCTTNGDGKITYVSSNKDVATVSADGNVLITGVGETVITATLAEGTNHTGGARQEITVTVKKASAPSIMGETRNYTYTNGSNGTVTIDVAGKLPKDRGETKYTVTTADGKGILADVSVDGNGNLVYTVLGNKSEGDTASITVTAEMANYETAAFTVDIELVKKKAVEPQAGGSVSIKGSNILTYGQTLSDLTLDSVIFVEQGTNTEVKGALAWKAPSDVPAVATGTAEWVFTPKDGNEYVELTGMVAITVVKATPEVEAPTVDTVTYSPSLTLDYVGLTGGSATWTVGGSTAEVEGTWSWKDAYVSPSVGNSGYTAIFTPDDTQNYNTVERTVAVSVEKAEPYIEGLVSAAPITYGDSLSKSVLTGTAQYSSLDSTVVPGSFTWKDGTVKPAVPDSGNMGYTVVFTPSDSTNYSSVETEVRLHIEPAENVPNAPSDTMNVPKRCEKVSDVELPDGWRWQETDKDTALEIGVPLTATAVYAGADKENYKNTEVTITITRADCDHEKTEIRGAAAATCQKEGYSGDTYCLDCGELLQKGNEIPLTDHSGGTATCISGKICAVCGAEYSGKDSGNHTHTEIRGAVEATCTADGYTGDTYCTDCNAKISSGTVIQASGHDWHITSEEAATTTSEGKRVYTCSKCRQTKEENIPKLPQPSHTHSYSTRETKAATCTENGEITYSCSCGDSYTRSTQALGHSYRSETTRPATTKEPGIRTYTCVRCGNAYTESIPKLPDEAHKHSYAGRVTKEASCTETGVRTYVCACGDSYTVTIPTQGHSYTHKVTTEPTTKKDGVRTYTCTHCGSTFTERIPKLPDEAHKHDYGSRVAKEASCTEAGIRTYTCACGDSYTENIPAPGHSYISKVTQEPTVSAEGVMTYTCARCGDSYTKPIAKLADTPSEPGNQPESGKPFIKDESGKEGWTVIREETDKTGEGNTVTVDMNGSAVVPGDVLENIRGRDVTIVFDMGDGITWSVNGKSVRDGEIGDIDFSVETGTEMIPVDVINNLVGERYSIQISLAHEGEFGFTAVLSINLGRKNAGLTASLYYYKESTGELEHISSGEVAEDGMVSLAFAHASDYVIVVGEEEGGEDVSSNASAETPESGSTGDSGTSPQTGQPWRPWWIVVIGTVVAVVGIGVFFVMKKRKEDEDRR